MARRTSLVVAFATLALGCGRTDLLWGIDSYASESTGDGDEATGDGDGDDEPTGDGDGDGDDDPTGDGDGDDPTGDGDGDPIGDGDGDCSSMAVNLVPQQPPVIVLLDRGDHMAGNFAGPSRWEAIGLALFDPIQGVSWAWEDVRRLGLASFTSFGGDGGGACPVLEIVAPAALNAATMEASFLGQAPEQDNPLADALTAMIPLFAGEPGHLVLLTGRNPDTCATPNPQQGGAQAVLAAQDAFAAGIQTHLVAVGNLTGNYPQSLANAGAGMDGAPWLSPNNLAALATGLDGLLAGLGSCELGLGVAVADPSACVLELDGAALIPDDPNGWSQLASDRVQLNGAACAALDQGASVAMTCSCDAF